MNSCKVCSGLLSAKIKEVKLSTGYIQPIPVWFCNNCQTAFPTRKASGELWLNYYPWQRVFPVLKILNSKKCYACNTDKALVASVEFHLTLDFPFYTENVPSWECTACGYSEKATYIDRQEWFESYRWY